MGSYSALLLELSADDRFRFILAAVESVRTNIKTGLRITIQAEFDAHVGFGSSAAVTVGVHAALVWHLTGQFPEKRELFLLSLNTVHQVQGCGSGADVGSGLWWCGGLYNRSLVCSGCMGASDYSGLLWI